MINVPAGLLYYLKASETISVPAKDNEIRGTVCVCVYMYIYTAIFKSSSLSLSALLIARNHLARYHDNHWDHVTLPEMLREPRTCQHCPHLKQCALYHK